MFGDDTPARPRAGAHSQPFSAGFASLAGHGSSDSGTLPLAHYWALLLRRRLLILGTLIAVLVIGITATLLMRPIYSASVTLQLDREAARVLEVDDVSPRESMVQGEEFFQTQYGVLQSRSLAERVVDTMGLANSDTFLERMGKSISRRGNETDSGYNGRRRAQVLTVLRENFHVSPNRGSRLVSISFESPIPELSAEIVNVYAEQFITANLDRKYDSSAYARQFLEERIAQTKARLEETERALVAYAANQEIINIREADGEGGQAESLVSRDLASMNAALSSARAARVAAEQKWRVAQSAPINSVPEVLQNPAIQRLAEERAKVNAEYQEKSRLYLPDWPEVQQLRARLDELDAQYNRLATSVRDSIRTEYTVARNAEMALIAQVANLKGDVLDLRNRSIQYNILERELDTSRSLYDGLLQRYKEVGVAGGLASNNISIVDRAIAPREPTKPNLPINFLISGLLGLVLGIAAALLVEALDETMATPEDVELKIGVPLLGVIPLLDKDQTPVSALGDPRSKLSEAYSSLQTALQFSTAEGAPKSLLTTSSRPAEGKSTTAYAIAVTMARTGKSVLLVDGDLRNPSMHRVIGVENDYGLSNLLSGGAALDTLLKPTSEAGLSFIPCGPLPPSPAALLSSSAAKRFLEQAGERFDHVIIDGPPVLGFADAPLLASSTTATLFVLEAKGTKRGQARGALRRLTMTHARVLGAVLTKFDTSENRYGNYDYAYDYDYGPASSAKSKRGKRA
jgi:capsular exopolysaccharide synthesis family protein